MQKMVQLLKPEACNQTVLQDRSLLVRLKLVENAKIENLKCDIWDDFQSLLSAIPDELDLKLML